MPLTADELRARLKPVEVQAREIEQQLSDPAVSQDPARVKPLTRDYRRCTGLLARLAELEGVEHEMAETRTLVEDQDEEVAELARAELAELEQRRDRLAEELEQALVPRSPDWDKGCIVEIRAAAGGEEAALFCGDLYRMYQRWSERHGLKVELIDSRPSELKGYKEVIFSVEGEEPYRKFRFESGVHRVQRVPETEASGRIHTSTATVAVLPEAEEVDVKIDPAELRVDVFRAGGHGGQHVNVTDSAVRITHLPSGLVVQCQDERSQGRNKAKAMKVLAARLLERTREQEHSRQASARRGQIGTGERSEKIRTYNFPQNRVTDHRIKLTIHSLDQVLEGSLDPVFAALEKAEAELNARA